MQLSDYCRSERGAASKLAAGIGAPPVLVSQWVTNARPVPIERCVPIENATAGAVRRWDLRPNDWHLIWPELIAHPDAPPTPEREAA